MNRKIRILVLLIFLIFLILMVVTGCNRQSETDDLTKERVLIIDETDLGYPAIYTVSPRGRGFLINSFMFDTLTWKDENGVIPLLARDWEVEDDNKTWTFYLNDDVKFSDGETLTADDVKFSFEYFAEYPHPWISLDIIDELRIINDTEVQIILNEVYAPFLTEVTGNVPILPEHIWKDVTEPARFNSPESVIGSGPFILENYDTAAGAYVFKGNKDYFLGSPVVDKLIFTQVDNAGMALRNGDLGAAQRISYEQAMRFKEEGEFNVKIGPGFWVYRLYFNFSIPEFNEKELRQAMYYAIDREDLIEKGVGGGGQAGNPGHLHPESEWYSPDVKEYEYNPEKARGILDNAGIVDTTGDSIREFEGKPLIYELLVDEGRVRNAEIIKRYLEDIGISVEIKSMDSRSLDALIDEGNFELALKGHGSMGGDPVLLSRFSGVPLGSTPGSTAQDDGSNWQDDRFDEIFLKQLKVLDEETRYKKVEELQQIIAEELPTLNLYYTKICFAYDKNQLNGWFFTRDGVARAVPTINNKLVYIKGSWGEK